MIVWGDVFASPSGSLSTNHIPHGVYSWGSLPHERHPMRSHLARTTTTARTTQATTRMTTLAALATASMIALTGCSSSSTPQSSNTTTPSIEITDTTVILD